MKDLKFFALALFIMSGFTYAGLKEDYEKVKTGKAIIIDVREKDEVKDGVIKGAVWFPLSRLEKDRESEFSKIKKISKDKEIYLYCRSGNRSGKYQKALEDAGIKSQNVGGYPDLMKEGLPTQSGL